MKTIMNCWVRETWIRDIYLASTNYGSLGKLFRKIINVRVGCVLVANTLSLFSTQISGSLPEQKLPLYVQTGPGEGCCPVVTQGSRVTKAPF